MKHEKQANLAGCPSGIAYATKREECEELILAERERCAKVAEDWLAAWGERGPTSGAVSAQTWANDAIRDIIDEIRLPSTDDGTKPPLSPEPNPLRTT